LPSNLRPANLRVHVVTSGHVSQMAVTSFDPDLLQIEVLHCTNRDFNHFCSCDLDLDHITFIYELDQYSLGYIGCANMNFLCRGCRFVGGQKLFSK